jgi:hypothetical protein
MHPETQLSILMLPLPSFPVVLPLLLSLLSSSDGGLLKVGQRRVTMNLPVSDVTTTVKNFSKINY